MNVWVLPLSPILDVLHVNLKVMKMSIDYVHFSYENCLILNPACENILTQLSLLHINSSYFHKKRKERDSWEETTYYKQRNCIIMREIKGNCCCFCWDFNAEVRPCCTGCIINFIKIYLPALGLLYPPSFVRPSPPLLSQISIQLPMYLHN